MRSPYAELCRDIGREFNADDIDAVIEDGFIEIDGVAVALDTDDEEEPTTLTCFVDLGEVGEENRLEILERVMATNQDLIGSPYGAIGLDEETDHLVLSRTAAWGSGSRSSAVFDLLRRLARYASTFEMRHGPARGGAASIDAFGRQLDMNGVQA